jgi:acyl-CoA thioesterase FadM
MTRVHYFKALLGTEWDWKSFGVVLVKNEIEYKKPVLLHDSPEIEMFTEHIGDKSFTLGYHLKVNNEMCTFGRSVMVCFDANSNKTIPVPEEMRKGLSKLIK